MEQTIEPILRASEFYGKFCWKLSRNKCWVLGVFDEEINTITRVIARVWRLSNGSWNYLLKDDFSGNEPSRLYAEIAATKAIFERMVRDD